VKTNPRNALLDFTRGALMGATTDAVGYIPDAVADAMRPFGYDVPRDQVVGGSDWLASKFTSPTGAPAEMAGRFLTGMVTPGPNELLGAMGVTKQAPVNELITYHSSPHRINNVDEANPTGRFDVSKVGTGEGNQAFGHGIYLSEDPVMNRKYYYEKFKGDDGVSVKFDDRGSGYITSKSPSQSRRTAGKLMAKHNMDVDAATRDAMRLGLGESPDDVVSEIWKMKRAVENGGKLELKPGEAHFYTVDLPDEHIAKMLDWDKELSKQPASVRQILKESGILKEYKENLSDFSSPQGTRGSVPRGERLHEFLSWKLGGPEKAAEKLKELGIPGIQYLDGGSRTAGKGTRNFVIFDGDTAKILKRE
jgi:hypothetical protein